MSRIERERRVRQDLDPREDLVNNPVHYKGKGGLEAVVVCEAFNLPMHLGQAVQYILRAGKKDEKTKITDLRKALWFIERYMVAELKVTPGEIDVSTALDREVLGLKVITSMTVDGVAELSTGNTGLGASPFDDESVKIHD